MSLSMYMKVVPKEQPPPVDITGFKHVFARRFLGNDGSLRSEPYEIKNNHRAVVVPWLEGYIAGATVRNAKEDALRLLSAIQQNPQGVVVWVGDWMDYSDIEPEDDDEGEEEPEPPIPEILAREPMPTYRYALTLSDHQMFGSGN